LAGLAGTVREAGAEMLAPLAKSLLWAGAGATATVLVAWPLAWLARRPGPWRWAAAACAALALATPGPVAGMALVLAYNAPIPEPDASALAQALFRVRTFIYDTPAVLVVGYVLRTLPYALLVLWPALRRVPETHLESAQLDGYGPWGRARRVALPLTRGAVVAAWGVAFVLALGELPVALVVDPPSRTPLLTVRVWALLHTGVESHLAGVGLVLLGAVGAAGLAASWALGRLYGLGAGRKIP
jgi:iron(III) transport system permease protein